jgi:hypothetical protein
VRATDPRPPAACPARGARAAMRHLARFQLDLVVDGANKRIARVVLVCAPTANTTTPALVEAHRVDSEIPFSGRSGEMDCVAALTPGPGAPPTPLPRRVLSPSGTPPHAAPLIAGLPPPRASPPLPRSSAAARSAAANRLLVTSPAAETGRS